MIKRIGRIEMVKEAEETYRRVTDISKRKVYVVVALVTKYVLEIVVCSSLLALRIPSHPAKS